MGLLDRLRATPWHAWLAIGLGFVGAILAWRAWQNHQAASSGATGSAIVPVGGTDTPNYAALGAGQTVQGNQLLDALNNLSDLLSHPSMPDQHTTPDVVGTGAASLTGYVRTYTVSNQDVQQGLRLGDIAGWWASQLHGVASTSSQLYQWNQGTVDATAQAHGVTPSGTRTPLYQGEVLRLPYRP